MRLAIIGRYRVGCRISEKAGLSGLTKPIALLDKLSSVFCFDGQVPGVVLVHAEQRAGDSLQQDQVHVELNFSPAFSCPNS